MITPSDFFRERFCLGAHLAELLSTDRRGRGIGTTTVSANDSHRLDPREHGVERFGQSEVDRDRVRRRPAVTGDCVPPNGAGRAGRYRRP
jgi:hypothetical protein